MQCYASAAMSVIYITGLIIGSLFGVFSGIVSLIAVVFAVKLFKYSRSNAEPSDASTSYVQ
jgi:predicted Co/Zn/Cd cation transporter (cation efflux family)